MCDLDPKVKVIGQKAGICDGVPSTSALVEIILMFFYKATCIKAVFFYITMILAVYLNISHYLLQSHIYKLNELVLD